MPFTVALPHAPQPNRSFNADANKAHGFAIFTGLVGTLHSLRSFRCRLPFALDIRLRAANMQSITSLVKGFCKGHYDFQVPDHNWPLVFKKILEYQKILNFEKSNIHTLWTVNGGHLRRKIKNDKLVAQVLSLTLPGYIGEGLTLYRGECSFLYDSGQIGFCWTPEIDVAIKFASGLNAIESGGVLLKAYVPSVAIFCGPNHHSAKQMKEFEYTCNPYLLESVTVIERYENVEVGGA